MTLVSLIALQVLLQFDLYPHDNGMEHYGHDGGNHSSMTARRLLQPLM